MTSTRGVFEVAGSLGLDEGRGGGAYRRGEAIDGRFGTHALTDGEGILKHARQYGSG